MSPSKVSPEAPSISFTEFYNIVDGKIRVSQETCHGISAETEENLWGAPVAQQQDVEDAVTAANRAFTPWSRRTIDERAKAIKAWNAKFMSLAAEFTELSMKEGSKPETIAKYEVELATRNVTAYSDLRLLEEEFEMEDRVVHTRFVPLGVVACICPWNWPIIIAVNKIAPALITGNSVILKPSPFAPYTIPKLVEIGQEFFPPGVLQVLGGNESLGPWLVEHPKVHQISFTGSIPTGKKIMAEAAKTLKRVTLELGGNDAMIVCEDVDIQKVAPQVAWGAFRNSGQACVASKRIYIHESIYQAFVDLMVQTTSALKIGPLQNKMQYDKIKAYLADSKSQNHDILIGGTTASKLGYHIEPTIVGNPPDDSRIVVEEQFGPIVPVMSYSTEEEVIRRANDTLTGLGACVYSADVERASRIGREMECGSVWINSYEKPTARACMSGHKESGIGGEGGLEGLRAYCNVQVLHVHRESVG